MVDSVIVTVVCRNRNFEADMELPAALPLYVLKEQLLEVLKRMRPELFFRTRKIQFVQKGAMISEYHTLAEIGAWDGSFLEIIEEG